MRLGALLLLAAACAAAEDVAIRMDGGVFRVSGWRGGADCASVFTVYAGAGDVPGMLGTCTVEAGELIFRPRFPISPGTRVRAVFRAPGGAAVERVFELPAAAPRVSTTRVAAVYPSASVLPSNELKFYLYFSGPMQRGEAWRHIHLVDHEGKPIDLPFLEIEQELWDPDATRLTVLFDPGRIKRGLASREEMGPALVEGLQYTLVIDREWPDGHGAPLTVEYRKVFQAGPADRKGIDPSQWKVAAPKAGSRDALTVRFEKPLDYALLQHSLTVQGPSGAVAGTVAVSGEEREWRFTPERAWPAGAYQVTVQTNLEDLAGNHVGREFDVDVFDQVTKRITTETVSLRFRVGE